MDFKQYIASIPDFPKTGVLFRDITPLLGNGPAFHEACERLIAFAREVHADIIVGPESRGFLLGCPIAYALQVGFVPIRKPGKLPRETLNITYDLEYGSNELQMHADGIQKGQRVLIIDDLLATGGTADAVVQMVEKLGAEVAGCAFLIELADLKGRELLKQYPIYSLMTY
ncbi:MAG: adenine phosphoribosyltransferase [Erysipelotrichaceae bacterium]|nr:adenine phosphoribosyltransferase [Erysipelotrichaceae bacterium]MCI9312100.1 adenine phosphoribosyltransferase [Erysipelotrichaceae bacterium]